jgi:hypothetical protein
MALCLCVSCVRCVYGFCFFACMYVYGWGLTWFMCISTDAVSSKARQNNHHIVIGVYCPITDVRATSLNIYMQINCAYAQANVRANVVFQVKTDEVYALRT